MKLTELIADAEKALPRGRSRGVAAVARTLRSGRYRSARRMARGAHRCAACLTTTSSVNGAESVGLFDLNDVETGLCAECAEDNNAERCE
jgi:hypothetical protein